MPRGSESNPFRSKLSEGGPAFPVHPEGATICNGMTLRDYFAIRILQADIIAEGDVHWTMVEDQCKWAYDFADAMLKAREN